MHRALRRKVLRQRLPLAAGPQHIEYGVENLTYVHTAFAPATLGRSNERLDHSPLLIRHVTVVAKPSPAGQSAVFGLPHRRRSFRESEPTSESQLIHQTQQVLGSALRERTACGTPRADPARPTSRQNRNWC